jgi:uncharacterized hydrophobic protein (TIGR00271 family)
MTHAMPATPDVVDARMSLASATLDDLFPEGEAFRQSLISYTVLLSLAGLVATFGLFQDSVASIIGAMVIAPLGGAILAVAGALVTGRSRWLGISFLQVVLSAIWVVAIAYLISWVMPDLIALTPSLEARTEPGLLDLGVALAAGAAGAWVAARRTGSDALPGVAIAVSLVPPLATVGICLELGRMDDAVGALLLFLTNFASITVIASIVFILTGASATRDTASLERATARRGLIVAVLALVVVAVPLAWQGVAKIQAQLAILTGAPVVTEWIGSRDLTVTDYSLDGKVIEIVVAGADVPRDVPELADRLADALGYSVDLTVTYVPRVRVIATGGGG